MDDFLYALKMELDGKLTDDQIAYQLDLYRDYIIKEKSLQDIIKSVALKNKDDILENNKIHDDYRISYIRNHIKELKKGNSNVSFPLQVPANSIFVLSDVRDNIFDSRIEEIGSVKESDIIGKVILKIYPINNIKFI